jgi:hypothetical protein
MAKGDTSIHTFIHPYVRVLYNQLLTFDRKACSVARPAWRMMRLEMIAFEKYVSPDSVRLDYCLFEAASRWASAVSVAKEQQLYGVSRSGVFDRSRDEAKEQRARALRHWRQIFNPCE